MSHPQSRTSYEWDYPEPFILNVTAGDEHIDGLQHVNNAVYVSWCQDAGWQHSQALGLSLADYQRLDRAVAIRHAEYDYVAAAYLGDQLLVGTWLTHCDGRLTMERQFQILRAEDGAVVLRGRWQLVSIGISSGKVQRMPREFAEIYGPAVVRSVQS